MAFWHYFLATYLNIFIVSFFRCDLKTVPSITIPATDGTLQCPELKVPYRSKFTKVERTGNWLDGGWLGLDTSSNTSYFNGTPSTLSKIWARTVQSLASTLRMRLPSSTSLCWDFDGWWRLETAMVFTHLQFANTKIWWFVGKVFALGNWGLSWGLGPLWIQYNDDSSTVINVLYSLSDLAFSA
jgi:hypothetical protein